MFRNPPVDLLVILLIVLLFLGPKRLPQLGKSLGHGLREFKDGITGNSTPDEDEDRPELTAASATPAATTDRDAAPAASSERRP